MTFTTPIGPLEPTEMWCVWEHGGVYEWMVTPKMAKNLIATGIKIDGEWCPVSFIDEWPGIGAYQVRAVKRYAVSDGFTDAKPLRAVS